MASKYSSSVDDETSALGSQKISSLTDSQERLMSVLTITTATLSVLGSGMIVYLVLHSTRKSPYKRIMLGLSLCDIVASITWAIAPFLLPADTSQRAWARGTDNSCSFLGFLTQMSFSAIWYNGALSYYYLLTVRFGVKPRAFSQRYEPIMHILVLGYSLGTAVMGYAKGYYSETEMGQGCWVAEFPEGCEANGGCTGNTIGWIFAGLPFAFVFLSIIVNNLIIYRYVRKTTERTTRKSMRGPHHQKRRIQMVANQALLYVGTFMLAYIWTFAIRVAGSGDVHPSDEDSLFPVYVLQAFFFPMQGGFNLFVYSWPNYQRIREAQPFESRLRALRKAWFETTSYATSSSGDKSLCPSVVNGLDHTSRTMVNMEELRLRASSDFTATFSVDGPLRQDIQFQQYTLGRSCSDVIPPVGKDGWDSELGGYQSKLAPSSTLVMVAEEGNDGDDTSRSPAAQEEQSNLPDKSNPHDDIVEDTAPAPPIEPSHSPYQTDQSRISEEL